MTPKTIPELLELIKSCKKEELFRWKSGKEWRSLSSQEFVEKVRGLACHLHDSMEKPMIHKGDRVAFLIYNGPEWHIVRIACAIIGAISVPILTEASDHDLEIILRKSQPNIIIVKDSEQQKRVQNLLSQWSMEISIMKYTVDTVFAQSAFTDFYERAQPNDLAMIFYTSGTTSDPKGVMHTHRSILANIDACSKLFELTQDDVVLSFMPVSHIFPQAADTLALMAGATIVYVDGSRQVATALTEVQPTAMVSMPRMFELIAGAVPAQVKKKLAKQGKIKQVLVPFAMKMGEWNYSSSLRKKISASLTNPFLRGIRRKVRAEIFGPRLRFFISGGAPLTHEVGAFMQGALELPIYQGWGMTEVAGAGTCNAPGANTIGSCGKIIPNAEIEIRRDHLDEDFKDDLPKGAGEIFIRGESVTTGYYGDPEATSKALQDGWLKTGDIGKIDKNGILWIVGRKQGVIVLESGLKVHEDALAARIRSACNMIDQIVILGHKRPHLVALISPNALALDSIPKPHRTEEGAWTPEVKRAIRAQLKQVELATHERLRDITLLEAQDGTLTPSQKPRHHVILEKYGELIESMYK